MATTTPNYGWPVPTSTDLVKDGATAIEALGDAIDATVFGLPASGFALINATTFTAQASVSLNNVFSATYSNYFVSFNVTASSATVLRSRLRVSAADNTASSYVNGSIYVGVYNSQALASVNNVTATYLTLGSTSSTVGIGGTITYIAPFATQYTKATAQNVGQFLENVGCVFNATTSFDGFSIFPDSGTITGTIRVYGLRN